ncbi:MAG: bifunctional diaminohydroxyphosphoribosylaminopyrimidine deaminase/5-amino-6-(5-phosphoribosylamino)uracil reductase RibD [Syntrophaceae bacterium]
MKGTDEKYMMRALGLARKGLGRVSPNPMVGAVIVKGGRIIGEGWHGRYGGKHAEIEALEKVATVAGVKGSTLYVTLEPCAHFGKTPPCVDRVIAAGITRVVIGTRDPNPLVAGKSIRKLRARGIETEVGILEEECRGLNEKFFKYMLQARPFVTLKIAQTLDGRIAASSGDSRWISSPASRRLAHRERSLHDAVMVGIGTVIQDDPELTVRHVRGRNPLRIVVDSKLRIPPESKILQDQGKTPTIVACSRNHNLKKFEQLRKLGIDVVVAGAGQVDLRSLLSLLAKENISSVLVEGGAGLYTSFLKEKLADRILAVIAPVITGKGIEAFGDLGIKKIRDAQKLEIRKILRREADVILDARLK